MNGHARHEATTFGAAPADSQISNLSESLVSAIWGTFEAVIVPVGYVIVGLGLLCLLVAISGRLSGRHTNIVTPVAMMFMGAFSVVAGSIIFPMFTTDTNIPEADAPDPSKLTPEPDPAGPGFDTGLLVVFGIVAAIIVILFLLYLLGRFIIRDVAKRRAAAGAKRAVANRHRAAWEKILAKHDELRAAYLAAETDWDMLFEMPALTDATVPETAAMIDAMLRAADTDPTLPDGLPADADLHELPYARAVAEFDTAWRVALATAKRIGTDKVPVDERRTIAQIRHLLHIAENTGATNHERQIAYERAQKLIGELRHVTVPKRAIAELETNSRLMITERGQMEPA